MNPEGKTKQVSEVLLSEDKTEKQKAMISQLKGAIQTALKSVNLPDGDIGFAYIIGVVSQHTTNYVDEHYKAVLPNCKDSRKRKQGTGYKLHTQQVPFRIIQEHARELNKII